MTDFFYRQLAKAARQETVAVGAAVSLKIDLALAHDGTGPAILKAFSATATAPAPFCRILLTLDHAFPAPTVADRQFHRDLAEFARQHRLAFYRNGEGVLHQVVAEEESLWPGMIIVGADGHVATAGAFGAIAFAVSPSCFVEAVAQGSYKLQVPEQLVITVHGLLAAPVMARDLAMHLLLHHGPELHGKAVLLTGSAIDALSVSEKMALCNFLPEGGIVTALILPQGEPATSDLEIDAATVGPLVAMPGETLSFSAPAALAEQSVTVAIVGGCSSGRLDDIKVVADILGRHGLHPEVTCLITPASRKVQETMDHLKLSASLRAAGAVVLPPGCGPCPGRHFGLLSSGDTAITTTIRAAPGRIGATGASIYLASPLTVAWSAVKGRITAPLAVEERMGTSKR